MQRQKYYGKVSLHLQLNRIPSYEEEGWIYWSNPMMQETSLKYIAIMLSAESEHVLLQKPPYH